MYAGRSSRRSRTPMAKVRVRKTCVPRTGTCGSVHLDHAGVDSSHIRYQEDRGRGSDRRMHCSRDDLPFKCNIKPSQRLPRCLLGTLTVGGDLRF
ncbi:hypothetical protein BDZ89DRAFT_41374 [Hymenopellis radicata]|nr:hypothetical protein BDZ89DRAFT_41374 [Hymenopellis radicata]